MISQLYKTANIFTIPKELSIDRKIEVKGGRNIICKQWHTIVIKISSKVTVQIKIGLLMRKWIAIYP